MTTYITLLAAHATTTGETRPDHPLRTARILVRPYVTSPVARARSEHAGAHRSTQEAFRAAAPSR